MPMPEQATIIGSSQGYWPFSAYQDKFGSASHGNRSGCAPDNDGTIYNTITGCIITSRIILNYSHGDTKIWLRILTPETDRVDLKIRIRVILYKYHPRYLIQTLTDGRGVLQIVFSSYSYALSVRTVNLLFETFAKCSTTSSSNSPFSQNGRSCIFSIAAFGKTSEGSRRCGTMRT